jgi:hypothetical protein
VRLDGEELLVQVWCKRHLKKDLFLGQSQIRITVCDLISLEYRDLLVTLILLQALNLPKEPQWYLLSEKTDTGLSGVVASGEIFLTYFPDSQFISTLESSMYSTTRLFKTHLSTREHT